MNFAVVGGDRRTVWLCDYLERDGHTVRRYGLPGETENLAETLEGADCVVLPLPLCTEPGVISMPLSERRLGLRELLRQIPTGASVCAGRALPRELETAREFGIEITDYLKREELAVKNAVATAEGAIGILMDALPETIWESRILIIGFGRIGKMLAHRLRGLGAEVWVSSRNYKDMAKTEAMGYRPLDTRALDGNLSGFSAVINTVPAMVLNKSRLKELPPETFCLDLASAPGGIDFAAAKELKIRTKWALSIPGKSSPAAAGRAIRDTLYHIAKEREDGR